jgi:hypothetical protein
VLSSVAPIDTIRAPSYTARYDAHNSLQRVLFDTKSAEAVGEGVGDEPTSTHFNRLQLTIPSVVLNLLLQRCILVQLACLGSGDVLLHGARQLDEDDRLATLGPNNHIWPHVRNAYVDRERRWLVRVVNLQNPVVRAI